MNTEAIEQRLQNFEETRAELTTREYLHMFEHFAEEKLLNSQLRFATCLFDHHVEYNQMVGFLVLLDYKLMPFNLLLDGFTISKVHNLDYFLEMAQLRSLSTYAFNELCERRLIFKGMHAADIALPLPAIILADVDLDKEPNYFDLLEQKWYPIIEEYDNKLQDFLKSPNYSPAGEPPLPELGSIVDLKVTQASIYENHINNKFGPEALEKILRINEELYEKGIPSITGLPRSAG